jgi:hypothetical protein
MQPQCQRWLVPAALQKLIKTDLESATTGSYASNTLLQAARRLAILIFGQELYYPRPHQGDTYQWLKRGYKSELSSIIGRLKVDAQKEEEKVRWERWSSAVLEAGEGFFVEMERLDTEKLERAARRLQGGLKRGE